MNRRQCINCQTTWGSLADHELETPHMCPRCGDQLVPVDRGPAERDATIGRART